MTYKIFDIVKTRVALPADGIAVGTAGTIVDVYADGEFEVEFANERGETLALVALAPNQLQMAHSLQHAA